jgi:hypothetical protein
MHWGFGGCSSVNLQQESRYCDTRYPDGDRAVWATRVDDMDRWHELSGFRSEKSRYNSIRIRDTAKSKIPTE